MGIGLVPTCDIRGVALLLLFGGAGHSTFLRNSVEVVEDLHGSLKREAAKWRSNRSLTTMPLSQLHFMFMFVCVCRECDVGGSDDAFFDPDTSRDHRLDDARRAPA